MTVLDTAGREVTGIAELFDSIYVVVQKSSNLLVFSPPSTPCRRPTFELSHLNVEGLRDPSDVAAHVLEAAVGRLYVVDRAGHSIWRVEIDPPSPLAATAAAVVGVFYRDAMSVRWARSVGHPSAVSVSADGQVVVVDSRSKELSVYVDREGRGECSVTVSLLRHGINHPLHAVLTPRRTFLVCQGTWDDMFPGLHRVSEIDGERLHTVRACGRRRGQGPGQLSRPVHLAEGRGGGGDGSAKFVLDDHRVLMLSEQLTVLRVLVTRPTDASNRRPHWTQRLCHAEGSGRLAVAWGGPNVHIYRIR